MDTLRMMGPGGFGTVRRPLRLLTPLVAMPSPTFGGSPRPPALQRRPLLHPVLHPLLALLLALGPAAVRADEVWAESVIDQASALRDASSKVPAGAQVQGSECSDVALPGLSYRYRCLVRYTPAQAGAAQPASGKPSKPASP